MLFLNQQCFEIGKLHIVKLYIMVTEYMPPVSPVFHTEVTVIGRASGPVHLSVQLHIIYQWYINFVLDIDNT